MQSRQPSQHPTLYRPDQLPAQPAVPSSPARTEPVGTDGAADMTGVIGVTDVTGAAPAPASQALDIPRPEHPRPDFQREHWLNLNGRWRFSFDQQNAGEQQRWYHVPHPVVAARYGESSPIEDPFGAEIVVPFPWESRLSGVFEPKYKGVAWYQRTIEVPADWAERS